MPKKKGKKKGGKKKGGKAKQQETVLDVPDYVDVGHEELTDYFVEADYSQNKKKAKKYTGFENVETRAKRQVDTLSEDDEVETVTSGRKSKAQLKKEKKARKKAEEERKKREEEEAKKKQEEQWSDDYSDEPLPKKKKGKKKKTYYSDSEDSYDSYDDRPKKSKKKVSKYSDSDYSDYSDYSDPPRKKKAAKKKQYDDYSDYSDYSDEPLPKKKKKVTKKQADYSSDYSDEPLPKKKTAKKSQLSDDDYSDYSDEPPKKKTSKKKSKYSDDDYSDYSDEPLPKKKKKTSKYDDYSSDYSDEPVSKKKSKKTSKKYDDYSDYSDDYSDEPVSKKKKSTKKSKYSEEDYSDDEPKKKVNKKDPTKSAGPSQRTLNKRKKAAKKNKWAIFDDLSDEPEPAKKKPPTMSDDSDSEEDVKPQKKKASPKKKVNLWDALMQSESEEEEDDAFDGFNDEVEKEPTPPPVAVVQPSWKNKKKKKEEKQEDEFDFFKEEPKKLSKAQLKRQRQKAKKEAEKKAAELAAASGQQMETAKEKTQEPVEPVDPSKPPPGLSKAALKRWKKKQKAKQKKNEEPQLTEAQKARVAKFEEQQRKRKEEEEEAARIAEEERLKREEEERIEEEKRLEAERKRTERNRKQREQKRQNKKRGNLGKLGGTGNASIEERRRQAAERKAAREAAQNKKKAEKNRKKQEAAAKKQKEEEERLRREQLQREKEEAEARAKAEAAAAEEKRRQEEAEREARNRAITEAAAQEVASKKSVQKQTYSDDDSDDWGSSDGAVAASPPQKKGSDWEDDEESEKNAWDDDDSENAPPVQKNAWDDDEDSEPEPPKQQQNANAWDDDETDEEAEQQKPVRTQAPPAKKEAEEKADDAEDKDDDMNWDNDSSEEELSSKLPQKKSKKKKKKKGRKKEIDLSKLRAPIGVIMGNVNAGKTALLDYIRGTKVQEGEAGGITQQIGATNLPMEDIIAKAGQNVVDAMLDEVHLPGLLVIDTPGHAAFDNLRERGSAMCDIAIVVVNIFNGMEGTTAECVNMLKENRAPFIIALNQIDRLEEWKSFPGVPIKDAIEMQEKITQDQFRDLFMKARADFASHCHLNADLFWESKDLQKNRLRSDSVNVVPTSAFSGDGVSDLLLLWVKLSQIPKIARKLVVKPKLRCAVLEVNKIQGHGHILDVIISDGYLRVGQSIACCGMNGPIVTKIRALLTPKATQDLRVKIVEYKRHREISASAGVRVTTVDDVSSVVPGSKIMTINNPRDQDEIEDKTDEVMAGLEELKNIEKSEKGVYVVASTLGSLQALVKFVCDKVNVPICGTSIGRVYKKDVMKAMVMLEKKPEWAVILAFDVDVDPAAAELADYENIRIFTAPIIYHLQTMFETYIEEVKEQARAQIAEKAVFPVLMDIIKEGGLINRKNPIILGVIIKKGTLRLNTPICAFTPDQKTVFLGRVTSIQYDNVDRETAKKDDQVAIKIDLTSENNTIIEFNRHFGYDSRLVSRISRETIDILRTYYRNDVTQEDLQLLKTLLKIFGKK